MKIKNIIIYFLALLIYGHTVLLSAEPLIQEKVVILEELTDEALNNNPQIQALYNSWKAAEYKVKQVTSLPDPMASYTYFSESIETKVGPQEAKYGLSQKIPFPGKLNLKGKTAQKHAQITKQKYEAVKRTVIKNVKFAYYDIWWVDRAIQVTESEKDILSSLERVAREKFQTNQTPQQDVIKAQVLISKLLDKLFLLRQQRKSLTAKMNSLLDRPKGTFLGQLKEFQIIDFKYSLRELHHLSRKNRQELIAADLDVEKKQFQKSLAKLDYFPDFTLGVNYTQIGDGYTPMSNDGQDAWMGSLAVNIPIWFGKLEAQLKEKKALLEAAKENYENVTNSIAYEVEDLYFKVISYKDVISLYKTALIPQTEQSFQAAKIAYESDEVDFLNWLDSEKVLLQTRLAYYRAIADYQKSIAFLERIVGKDL